MIAFQQASPARQRCLPPQSVTARMADAMLELAFSGQTVDAEALGLKGFSEEDCAAHGKAARDLANARAGVS